MDDRYFHGILGCEAVVCGRRLTNLTPWHVTILNAIDSPFMNSTNDLSASDLIVMIKVAGTQWPNMPDLKPRLRDFIWTIALKNKKILKTNNKILKEWLGPQLSTPRLWERSGNKSTGKTLSSPSMISLVVALVGKVNLTLNEAWNMRLSEGRWYDTVKAELDGASLKVAYDNEENQGSLLDGKTESEIIAIAREQLDDKSFKQWVAARRKNKK